MYQVVGWPTQLSCLDALPKFQIDLELLDGMPQLWLNSQMCIFVLWSGPTASLLKAEFNKLSKYPGSVAILSMATVATAWYNCGRHYLLPIWHPHVCPWLRLGWGKFLSSSLYLCHCTFKSSQSFDQGWIFFLNRQVGVKALKQKRSSLFLSNLCNDFACQVGEVANEFDRVAYGKHCSTWASCVPEDMVKVDGAWVLDFRIFV